MRTKGKRKTYLVAPRPERDGRYLLREPSEPPAYIEPKPRLCGSTAKEKARSQAPSQLLVYKKNGMRVGEEKT